VPGVTTDAPDGIERGNRGHRRRHPAAHHHPGPAAHL